MLKPRNEEEQPAPDQKTKYKYLVMLEGGEKVYAATYEDDDSGTVKGTICNYDGSHGGTFEINKKIVQGVITK